VGKKKALSISSASRTSPTLGADRTENKVKYKSAIMRRKAFKTVAGAGGRKCVKPVCSKTSLLSRGIGRKPTTCPLLPRD